MIEQNQRIAKHDGIYLCPGLVKTNFSSEQAIIEEKVKRKCTRNEQQYLNRSAVTSRTNRVSGALTHSHHDVFRHEAKPRTSRVVGALEGPEITITEGSQTISV